MEVKHYVSHIFYDTCGMFFFLASEGSSNHNFFFKVFVFSGILREEVG